MICVFDRLFLANYVRAIFHRIRGHSLFVCQSSLDDLPLPSLARLLRIKAIEFAELPKLVWTGGPYEEPAKAFVTQIQEWESGEEWKRARGCRYQDAFQQDVIRVALLQRASSTYLLAGAISTFLRTKQQPSIVYIQDPWLRLVMESMEASLPGLDCRYGWSLLNLHGLRQVLNRIIDRCQTRLKEVRKSRTGSSRVEEKNIGTSKSHGVAILVNRELIYRNLYRYDYVMKAKDSDTPLWDNAVFLSRDGGEFPPHIAFRRWPQSSASLMSAFWNYISLLRPIKQGVPRIILRGVRSAMRDAETFARTIKLEMPYLRLAVYTFDCQVPAHFTLGFALRGVKCVAVHERLSSGVSQLAPLAAEILVTGNNNDSQACMRSPSIAVRECRPIGLWRRDLFDDALRPIRTNRHVLTTPKRKVVVLPYELKNEVWETSIITGVHPVSSFLNDIIELAQERSDLVFVLRSKDMNWLSDPAVAAMKERIREEENIRISTDYSQLAESYRLCSEADLVIAKHTSLVDECMSAGIPCLLHDYSENYTGYAQSIIDYLPEKSWVQSRHDLKAKVDLVLPPEDFSPAPAPVLNDFIDESLSHETQVSAKIRRFLLEI